MSASANARLAKARARLGVPQPGQVVAGKYRVEDVIGAGGMGVVVSARHIELGQTVAIKFLDYSLTGNTTASARFFREARAAGRIRSEHVTRVLDVDRTETGVPYLVMEHLAGTDLERVQRSRGQLPVEEVLDYLLQACEALAEAHAAGVIHRDLKPGNLFLTHRADGSPLVKVLDFGISKIVDPDGETHDGATTTESEMLGSTWYMSPEQVRSSMSVDARTDVWSLGVILYQLLTGVHAFKAESMSACLAKIVADPPPPLRAARPDVPEGLERVILACLEKDPARRLQSVAELALALAPFAPECARLSIQRITRVLGPGPTETGSALERVSAPYLTPPAAPTPPVAAVTPPPSVTGPAPEKAELAPSPGQSTGASVNTTTTVPAPRPARRWPIAAAVVATLLGGGAAVAVRGLTAPVATPPAAAAAAVTTAPPPAVETAPAPSVAPAATAAPTSSAISPKPPEAPAPAAPKTKPVKRKLAGPVETTL
jgi:eukaryotic-like serine/threonine-protein kinase